MNVGYHCASLLRTLNSIDSYAEASAFVGENFRIRDELLP
jgi:hypothetical protein